MATSAGKPLVSSHTTYEVNKRLVATAALMSDVGVIDQIVNATPILSWSMGVDALGVTDGRLKVSDLRPSRQLKFRNGGIAYDFRARIGRNNTFKAIQGRDLIDTSGQEGFTKLSETPRLYAGSVSLDFESELQNMDAEAGQVDLMEISIEQGLADAQEVIQGDFWQTAAQASSKEIVGIPAWVASDPRTGTLATVNRANDTWFRNQYNGTGGFSTNATPSFGADGISLMIQAVIAAAGGQGADEPTDIWCATDVFRYFRLRLQPQETYMSGDPNDPAKNVLMWDGKPIRYDGGIASGEMYFLNRKYWEFNVHRRAFFTLTEFVANSQQLERVAKQIFYGIPICKRPARQAVITGWTS